jgi:hypothetical protein
MQTRQAETMRWTEIKENNWSEERRYKKKTNEKRIEVMSLIIFLRLLHSPSGQWTHDQLNTR